MWISKRFIRPVRPALWRRVLDAIGLAFALAFLPEVAAARAGVVFVLHPGWIAVLLLAARDGSIGLIAGLIAAAGAVGIGAAFADTEGVTALSRLSSGPNLIAFGACLAVSWVASWHLRRHADLCERQRTLSDRAAEAEAIVATLRDVVSTLRARVDRTWTSLSFLRDVAARLEGMDPVGAAEAAADLALARTGACAAAVNVGSGGSRRFLAVRDARGPNAFTPLALRDADLTVPIRSGYDRVGYIALWGIPRSGLDDATTHDLEVIASWCMPACATASLGPDEAVGRTWRVE